MSSKLLQEEQIDKIVDEPLKEQAEAVDVEEKVVEAIIDHDIKQNKRNKKVGIINKRIDFSRKTYTKIEMMMPIYRSEIESSDEISQNEVLGYVIKKAIDKLFDEDFKKRLEGL